MSNIIKLNILYKHCLDQINLFLATFGYFLGQNVVAGLWMPNTATTFSAELVGIKLKKYS